MKLLFKLLIAALLANATWRVGTEYLSYYRFKDAVRETTAHRGTKTDEQIHDHVFQLVNEYGIPATDEDLKITRRDNHTIVEGSYVKAVEVVPTFKYNLHFDVYIDTFVVEGDVLAR
jgi:hypothetical protein